MKIIEYFETLMTEWKSLAKSMYVSTAWRAGTNATRPSSTSPVTPPPVASYSATSASGSGASP